MTSHTRIDRDKFDTAFGQRRQKGIKLEIAMSPYDVPTDVMGNYCENKRKFVINFSYLGGQEETRRVDVSQHVVANKGVGSDRIYQLEIDVNGLGVSQVELSLQARLTEAINALNATSSNSPSFDVNRSQLNARVLREVRDHYLEAVTR